MYLFFQICSRLDHSLPEIVLPDNNLKKAFLGSKWVFFSRYFQNCSSFLPEIFGWLSEIQSTRERMKKHKNAELAALGLPRKHEDHYFVLLFMVVKQIFASSIHVDEKIMRFYLIVDFFLLLLTRIWNRSLL